jgi:hypothetical protein
VASYRVAPESVLVNFFYANPIGHAVEAFRYCLGYHRADPGREVSLVLNADSGTGLAPFCPFVERVYPVRYPFIDLPLGHPPAELGHIPRDWDWVVDEPRRYQEWQLASFPGFARYYVDADRHLRAGLGHGPIGLEPPSYVPHRPLRFELPEDARRRAAELLPGRPRIAVLPAGSGPSLAYPSTSSWKRLLGAVCAATGGSVVLIGKTERDGATTTSLGDIDRHALVEAAEAIDCFDLPLADELAVLEACDVLLSPHSGMGFTASCVDTPWATISGGRWPEYFFNGVPFRSVLPDPRRFPCYTHETGGPGSGVPDPDGEGRRTPSMSSVRIDEDTERIVAAVAELLDGAVGYEAAMADHARNLVRFYGGDRSKIFSVDGDLDRYLP